MGEISKLTTDVIVLTPKQQIIFDEVKNSEFIRQNFYFTGGTALASLYLHHRLSEDLDFFSEEKFDTLPILNLITDWSKKHKFRVSSKELEVVRIFLLKFADGEELKVDFGYYPYPRLKKDEAIDLVEIDSLLDIAVNKLQTIHQRADSKDFVDLFFLLKKFTIWDLIEGVRMKFRIEVDPYTIGASCVKVESFEKLPVMLVPLTLKELKDFYKDLARKLGSKAVRK